MEKFKKSVKWEEALKDFEKKIEEKKEKIVTVGKESQQKLV